MKLSSTRARLMSGVAMGLGMMVFTAQPAAAACNLMTTNSPNDTVACAANTTTLDTTFPANSPNDRNFTYGANVTASFANIGNGVLVDGFGFAITNGIPGTNALTITNDGTIQVNGGNTPTAGGGDGALFVTANGNPVIYGGIGDIINLGNGDGFEVVLSGAASLDATIGGSVVANNGNAINVTANLGSTGPIDITTTAGEEIQAANGDGIHVQTAGSGDVTIDSNADIMLNTAAAVGDLQNAIFVASTGTGDINITHLADGVSDEAQQDYIHATINNAASTGDIDIELGGGGIFNSAGNGINAQTTGSGDITIDSSDATINAGFSGIRAFAEGGNITVTAGDVTSTGATAIFAQQLAGAGNVTVTTTGTISGLVGINAASAGLGDVTVTTGAGLVTGTNGAGVIARNVNPNSTGNVLVNIGTGGVTSVDEGVFASTTGSGTVTVNSLGVITSTNSFGINASANAGAIMIDVTGGSVTGANTAILGIATSGTIAVSLSGGADVTGGPGASIDLISSGAKTVDVGAGSTVTGGIANIHGAGGSTLSISNAGTIGAAGGLAVLTDLATAADITNLGGGVLNGQVSLSDGDDLLTNGGTWNVSGGNAFNGGVDIVTNAAGGVINSATGTVFSDLEDLTTLGGSSFNVAGTLDFANVATSLTNGGALVLADGAAVTGLGVIMSNGTIEGGAGSSLSNLGNVTNLAGGVISTSGDFTLTTTGDFANAGMLDLAPALFTLAGATSFTNSGTINAIGGATDLVIPGLLDNSGAINLSNGVVGDVLTLTGDYVGSGNAVLNLDVTSQSATDRLVVVGAVSGTTSLNVNPVGSVITGTDGILVVDADTSTADAFVLGSTGAGLVNYSLLQQGADYYLIGLLNTNAFAPLLLDGVATDLWHQSADVVGTHLALKRQALGAGAGRSGLWGRFYWGRDRSGARHTQNLFGDDLVVDQRVETGRTGAQLGFDYKTGGAVIGFTAGYEHAGAEHVATSTGLKAGGYNLGVYGLLGSDTGFYGSLLAKYDHGQARLTNNALFDGVGKLSLDSWGVDGKAGYRWATGGGRLDVGGGLTWVRSSIEDFTVSGIDYDFATARSLRGQIGVRYEGRDSYGPYVDARLLHEFKDSNDVSLRSGTELDVARAEGRGTWGRLEVGVAPHGKSGPTAAIWAQVGDAHGIGVQAGWKF